MQTALQLALTAPRNQPLRLLVVERIVAVLGELVELVDVELGLNRVVEGPLAEVACADVALLAEVWVLVRAVVVKVAEFVVVRDELDIAVELGETREVLVVVVVVSEVREEVVAAVEFWGVDRAVD